MTETRSLTKSRYPSFSATEFCRTTWGQLVLSCCTAVVSIPAIVGYKSGVQMEAGVAVELVFPGFSLWLEAQQLLPVPGIASYLAR